jgi:amidase/aspartyl-tRNA(Asn)/glutamyl-tRNA(Gln) amidotransferase subunit A
MIGKPSVRVDGPDWLSAAQTARLVADGSVSPVEIVDACLERIDRGNSELNAFVTVLHDRARAQAAAAQRALSAGLPLGPLHGVPVAVKDLSDHIAGVRNTFGSVPLRDHVAQHTSVHIARLEKAGAIIVGKTNTPEFGHKGVTDNLLVGPARNPFDSRQNAGGSSGGSAAAVAAGMVPIAQGTDGGGSVRIPAALCNVVGFKPTFGRVPDPARPNALMGVAPFQHIGSMARSVDDAALLYSVMSGPHPRDPFSLPAPDHGSPSSGELPPRPLRIAFSPDWGDFPVESEVADVVQGALSGFDDIGSVEGVEVSFGRPHHELCESWLRMSGLICAEIFESFSASGVELLRDHRESITPELVRLVENAHRLSVHDVRRDQIIRTAVLDAVEDLFDDFDLIVTPTVAVSRVPNGSDGRTVGPHAVNGSPVDPLLGWCLTYPLNFTGHPAISVPAGLTSDGFPVGLQMVGRRFADSQLLAVAAAFEANRPWAADYPSRRPTEAHTDGRRGTTQSP